MTQKELIRRKIKQPTNQNKNEIIYLYVFESVQRHVSGSITWFSREGINHERVLGRDSFVMPIPLLI